MHACRQALSSPQVCTHTVAGRGTARAVRPHLCGGQPCGRRGDMRRTGGGGAARQARRSRDRSQAKGIKGGWGLVCRACTGTAVHGPGPSPFGHTAPHPYPSLQHAHQGHVYPRGAAAADPHRQQRLDTRPSRRPLAHPYLAPCTAVYRSAPWLGPWGRCGRPCPGLRAWPSQTPTAADSRA